MGKKVKAKASDVAGPDLSSRPAPAKLEEEVIDLSNQDLGLGRVLNAEDVDPGYKGLRGKPRKEIPKEPEMLEEDMSPKMKKYERGVTEKKAPVPGKGKWENRAADRKFKKNREAAFLLAKNEVLQTEETGFLEAEDETDCTWKYSQEDLLENATIGVAKKRFQFALPYGPYHVDFTRNGSHVVAGGRKGQIALLNCETMNIMCELQAKESVRAVQFLHDQSLFAVAQKKHIFIYDKAGTEIHMLREIKFANKLDFLRYHFLLVASGERGDLHYRDVSTGEPVVTHRTKLGMTQAMRQDPTTGIMNLGHTSGCISMWTPTISEPVVKMWAHQGSVNAIACYGNYMVTAGAEGLWKVWDMRKRESMGTYKTYGSSACDIDISFTGLVSVGFGSHLQIWKDVFSGDRPKKPYMTEEYPGRSVTSLRFRPTEDVLGVGHSDGFESIIVPGAGLANIDTWAANPYETSKQRKEREVHSLLEKLQPDSIMLDPSRIGSVDKTMAEAFEQEQKEAKAQQVKKEKKKKRGKGKIGARLKRKTQKISNELKARIRARLAAEGKEGEELEAETEKALQKELEKVEQNDDDEPDDEEEVDPEDDDEGEGKDEDDDDEDEAGASSKRGAPSGALGRFYGKRPRRR